MLRFHNHVNLIAISNHHHHHNSNPRCYSCVSHHQPPLFTQTFPWATPKLLQAHTTLSSYYSKLILLWAHYHWHILCQCYLVIIGGYHLRLFSQHFELQLCVSGYRHAQNDLLYLSHVYSMSQNFLVVIVHILVCIIPVLNLDSAPPTCSQNLVWASSLLLINSLSCSLKFRTRRQWVTQHIHWGQSPIIIQVLCLGIYLKSMFVLFRFQLQINSIYQFPSCITA